MALNFFDSEESTPQVDTPFVEDYLKSNPDEVGSIFDVEEVIRTRKGNGYLFKTQSFIVFMWNRNKTLALILEALKVYSEGIHGYKIVFQLIDKSPYYRVAVDPEKPTNWFGGNGRYSVREIPTSGLGVEEEAIGNPFLISPPNSAHNNGRTSKRTAPTQKPGKTSSDA
jgi:hypothetical protein